MALLRGSVACETPVSLDSAVAVTAPRPVIFLIMLALKAAEYDMVVFSDSRPACRRLRPYAVARFMRQLP